MNEDQRANTHSNMVIQRLRRELEETKDEARKLKIEEELAMLRAAQMK